MAAHPPQGFTDLEQARGSPTGTFVNVIGVVVDIMPAGFSRQGEHMMTFKLLDRPLRNSLTGSMGFTVRFFTKDVNQLPKVRALGDVVLLKQLKIFVRDGQPVGTSNYQTGWLVFPHSGIPDLNFSIAYLDKQKLECLGADQIKATVTFAEQQYIMSLKQDMGHAVQERSEQTTRMAEQRVARETHTPQEPAAKRMKPLSSFGPKFRLIEELRPKTFADLCGKVVKNITAAYGGNDLYITDYTSNELARYYPPPEEEEKESGRDGDTFGYNHTSRKGWPGPYEQTILKVNLKPPHAATASQILKEGDFTLLRNVKIRTTDDLKLEGDLWPDSMNPEKIQVRKLSTLEMPEIQAILAKEEKYWNARNTRLNIKPQLTRKQLKKQRSKQRKEQLLQEKQQQQHQQQRNDSLSHDDTDNLIPTSKKTSKNPHIRCSHEDIAVTKLKDILDPENRLHTATLPDGRTMILPFINVKYRARVRVVDFSPHRLEDFAVPPEPDSDASLDSMAWQYDTPRYEWHFALQLEDATTKPEPRTKLWVQVPHDAAQFLLGNSIPDPENLAHNPRLLAQVREKLFVLWGDLEEKRLDEEDATGMPYTNLPFECCLMEYGVEVGGEEMSQGGNVRDEGEIVRFGWKRMYSLFGTTIL